MSDDKVQTQNNDPFTFLYKYRFAQLNTYRKSGVAVPTPVWFASHEGKLYVMTNRTTGKVKRIHNNGRVMLIPCNQRGKLLSDEKVEAKAHEVPSDDHQRVDKILARKYGLLYRIFTVMAGQKNRTYIEIEPS